MSRWHRHEWDMLPERAFQPRGPHGQMTLEGGGGGGSQVVGYRYYFGLHMGVCRGPVDQMIAIRVGEKLAWWGNITGNTNFYIDNANLFGGEKGEGGIQGWCAARFGAPTQDDNFEIPSSAGAGFGWVGSIDFSLGGAGVTSVAAMTGTPQPNFRGVFTLFYDGLVTALNPYPKKWSVRARRILQGWQPDTKPAWVDTYGQIIMMPADFATLSYDWGDKYIYAMNPAAIIYECLTNREWGRGLHPTAVDGDGSFAAAAQKLFEEGFGLCIKWSRKESIQTFIQTILNHIGASIYTDRRNGLITLKLIRDDYVVSALPRFTPESGLLEVSANDVTSTDDQINEIQVTYRHAVTNENRTVRTDSLGAVMGKYGVVNSSSRNYIGIPTAQLALRVAERDLKAVASNLRRFTFILDRRGYNVYPGQAIRIASPAMNIPETIVRVGKTEDNFRDGKIKVMAVEDVFGLPSESFGGSVGTTWTPPDNTPCVPVHSVFEAPYFMVARYTTASDFAYIDTTSAGLMAVADKGKALNGAYDIAVRTSAPTSDDNPPDTSYNCPI